MSSLARWTNTHLPSTWPPPSAPWTSSPLEVLDATLARIDARNPELNAVIWRNDDEARAEAKVLGDRIAAGTDDLPPFAGVPLPIKDLLAVAGQPVTYGSEGAPAGPSTVTEPVARRLPAGRLHPDRPDQHPRVRIDHRHREQPVRRHPQPVEPGPHARAVPAAVRARPWRPGMFAVAHASDGGGSIRIPASCCGLVGLKPSRGRVASIVPGWQGMTTDGALTRTVADSAVRARRDQRPRSLRLVERTPSGTALRRRGGGRPGPAAGGPVHGVGPRASGGRRSGRRRGARRPAARGAPVTGDRLDADVFDPVGLGPFLHVVNSGAGRDGRARLGPWSSPTTGPASAAEAVDSLTFVRSLGRAPADDPVHRGPVRPRVRPAGHPDHVHRAARGRTPRRRSTTGAGTGMPPMEIVAMAAFTAVFNITGQPAISLPLYVAPIGAAGRRADRGRSLAGGPAGPGGLPARAGRSLGRSSPDRRLNIDRWPGPGTGRAWPAPVGRGRPRATWVTSGSEPRRVHDDHRRDGPAAQVHPRRVRDADRLVQHRARPAVPAAAGAAPGHARSRPGPTTSRRCSRWTSSSRR